MNVLSRPNRFEIDLDAVALCTQQIRKMLGCDITFFATLKANAYGYGLLEVAQVVLDNGADALSLASLPDAIKLREAGVTVPILVYAGVLPTPEVVSAFQQYGLIPTLHNEEILAGFARHSTENLEVAVKVDVGPERIGVPMDCTLSFIQKVNQHPHLHVMIVNAHPNVRGGIQAPACLAWQHQKMEELSSNLQAHGCNVKWSIMASSKVLRMSGKKMLLNAADPGAALFQPVDITNLNPSEGQPFKALKSKLIETRQVVRTEFPDEAPFDLRPGMRIGVLPIGYSDNVHLLHTGHVLVRGQRAPVVGKPALEYMRVDLSSIPDACVGDEVVIIGTQNGENITPEDVMQYQGAARVIDLALLVGAAVPRVYLTTRKQARLPVARGEAGKSSI